jgi:two-component system nitrate/nitrite response regulator NarL
MSGIESNIRILLIDDHPIFLAGLRSFLQVEPGLLVIGEARNRNEALAAARQHPDIILLDLDLGSESGADLLPDLMKVADGARVLLLTGVVDPESHLHGVCLGAMGVVHKLEAPDILVKAIRKVHAGEVWLNRTMIASAMIRLQVAHKKPDPTANKIASLTARELEVIAALGEGLRNREIGQRLFISEKTVRHYLGSIFAKLEVTDRLELMIFAYQHGLAKLPSRQSSPNSAVTDVVVKT